MTRKNSTIGSFMLLPMEKSLPNLRAKPGKDVRCGSCGKTGPSSVIPKNQNSGEIVRCGFCQSLNVVDVA